jgi:hypothetical protein
MLLSWKVIKSVQQGPNYEKADEEMSLQMPMFNVDTKALILTKY